MMCARELNSERACNGPCAEEAYFFHRCESFASDPDVSIYCQDKKRCTSIRYNYTLESG